MRCRWVFFLVLCQMRTTLSRFYPQIENICQPQHNNEEDDESSHQIQRHRAFLDFEQHGFLRRKRCTAPFFALRYTGRLARARPHVVLQPLFLSPGQGGILDIGVLAGCIIPSIFSIPHDLCQMRIPLFQGCWAGREGGTTGDQWRG